ncbi:putative transmembrane protein [Toxoplasma gondii TgCatPRC2]|uniref:Transmembrane protein n=7 Tax=Toxoplasma gondii TaxID=5811 RepID=S8G8T8_TOXGM|nr:hypothetical protein TGME49_210255 [Toxoplasma gondii ME49]ESS28369.1 putative transmembrane protein [Toxoplasma gondii VEG]KFH02325.1 putative transmembrane protein [Toxoplasma gondii MAS]KYF44853.1 hypothetical protein TGARI_210255 [Toxoplasma gondii ARI]KYK62425.1 putative transmembrane protein [Toxoplasma gondii TgCatPRC2]PIM00409.1 putative transmembrane protein [Toxoplasma gondii COUG]PUA83587.1 putative transmembrane protein [Toxoplasma gondii TgCATBr9]|eukprot:XP_018636511.1 hypothetical protein TGME49_210255 [Toxoplasma gondii ME49]
MGGRNAFETIHRKRHYPYFLSVFLRRLQFKQPSRPDFVRIRRRGKMGQVLSHCFTTVDAAYGWLGRQWDRTIQPLFHYGVIPALFVVGLAYTGELTLDPTSLFQKIVIN